MRIERSLEKALAAAAAAAALMAASGQAAAGAPENLRLTWFGISNWHYQAGDVGILLDGETISALREKARPDAASVAKAHETIRRRGTLDVILIGHDHPDHSVQAPEWARQTGKQVYAPASVCAVFPAHGVAASQCTTLKGGETIRMNADVTIRVVRWVHSIAGCTAFGHGTNGPETFGFLISAATTARAQPLQVFVSNSGAGGRDLTTPRVQDGATYGSPLDNLKAAMDAAGAGGIDLWQAGPESRVVNQARIVIPAFNVRLFQPHHLGVRPNSVSAFNLEYGLHFPYFESEQPRLQEFLRSVKVPQFPPVNYWDAWILDANGMRRVDSADQKAAYGIPASGAGPGRQGENPRAGQLECPGD